MPVFQDHGLNIISCPSCSRVENEAFIDLAMKVKEMSAYAKPYDITIAVMGCRVNGPGETDDADLGLWCAPNFVNLKRGEDELGAFPYDTVLDRLKVELDAVIETKKRARLSEREPAFGMVGPWPGLESPRLGASGHRLDHSAALLYQCRQYPAGRLERVLAHILRRARRRFRAWRLSVASTICRAAGVRWMSLMRRSVTDCSRYA